MAELGRLQPFVAATQSIAFAMPAKGNLRPGTDVRIGLGEGPLADHKPVVGPMLFIWPVLTQFGQDLPCDVIRMEIGK
jgi:hypothetical protein